MSHGCEFHRWPDTVLISSNNGPAFSVKPTLLPSRGYEPAPVSLTLLEYYLESPVQRGVIFYQDSLHRVGQDDAAGAHIHTLTHSM